MLPQVSGLRQSKALASIVRFVRANGDGPNADDIFNAASLLKGGLVTRDSFDHAVVSLLESVGVDGVGVQSWLDVLSDEDVSKGFSDHNPARPNGNIVSIAAGGGGRHRGYRVAILGPQITGFDEVTNPFVLGGKDVATCTMLKRVYEKAGFVCRSHSERAALGCGLHLEGIPFSDRDLVMLDECGKTKALVVLPTMISRSDILGLLARDGRAFVNLDDRTLSARASEGERREVLEANLLDASIDAWRDGEGMWVLRLGRSSDEPVYLCKTWGPGAEQEFPHAHPTFKDSRLMAEAIRRHEDIPLFGENFSREQLLAHPWASLRLDEYAQTVPPPEAKEHVEDVKERYLSCQGETSELQVRFINAYGNAIELIAGASEYCESKG